MQIEFQFLSESVLGMNTRRSGYGLVAENLPCMGFIPGTSNFNQACQPCTSTIPIVTEQTQMIRVSSQPSLTLQFFFFCSQLCGPQIAVCFCELELVSCHCIFLWFMCTYPCYIHFGSLGCSSALNQVFHIRKVRTKCLLLRESLDPWYSYEVQWIFRP